jgi:CheY-like chemotaxis protein
LEVALIAKILVVHDQTSTRKALVEIRKLEGYSILEAADGLSALEIIRVSEIDLILLDFRKPDMDGID